MAFNEMGVPQGRGYGGDKAEILQLVREGMQVYDSTDSAVGEVTTVRFGADMDAGASGAGPAKPARDVMADDDTIVDAVQSALAGESNLEDTELASRLRQRGFLRVGGAGLFQAARYVLPEQIDFVDGDNVHLNVQADRLLKD